MTTAAERELTCKEVVELVTDYLEDKLPADERRRFDYHLAGCPYCEIYLEQMRQTIKTLGHLPEESIAPTTLADLLSHFRRRDAQ